MIKLTCKIPSKVVLACSGGKDSMSALEFLVRGRRDVTAAYFNHDTPHGDEAEVFLRNFCDRQKIPFVSERYIHKDARKEPTEASWREARYEFLASLGLPIITAHHLKDAVEWWIFSSLRGSPSLIAPTREDIPVLRPFMTTPPEDLHKHFGSYEHIEDPTNAETKFTRNFIRHEILPKTLRVNPGIYTTVRNMYEKRSDLDKKSSTSWED